MSHLLHGDAEFLDFNPVWALALAAAALALIAMALFSLSGRPVLGEARRRLAWLAAYRPGIVVGLAVSLAAAGWITAMLNLETISA